jgi:photosystem II stability/assembly factor-like uncharacterized protein
VTPCPGIGATAGKWDDVTPPAVSLDPKFKTRAGDNFGTNAFVIDPLNTATVYLGTSGQGIYKTTDCGATWVHINTGVNGTNVDGGRNWTMQFDAIHNILYANNGFGSNVGANGLWKSANGGVDWQQVVTPNIEFVAQVEMDPKQPLHLVVTPHFSCTSGHTNCLMETEDGGNTWRVVDGAPPMMEGAGIMMLDHDTWFWAQPSGGLSRSPNRGATWTQVSPALARATIYRALDGMLYVPASTAVIRSADGINWSEIPNGPGAGALVGTGTQIYTSHGIWGIGPMSPMEPFSVASVGDTNNWSTVPSPLMTYGGGMLHHDPDHHLLYSSACLGGFWRLVTP